MKRTTISPLGTVAALILGCNSSTVDNSFLEPSRDSRIESLASSACDRYGDTGAGCPGYGTASNQKYTTEGDCKRDFESRAADLWPADKCGNGQINSAAYAKCEDRAKTFACSTGVTSMFDAIAALDDCKAAAVCTDPAR